MDLQVGVADALGTDYFFLKERLTDSQSPNWQNWAPKRCDPIAL